MSRLQKMLEKKKQKAKEQHQVVITESVAQEENNELNPSQTVLEPEIDFLKNLESLTQVSQPEKKQEEPEQKKKEERVQWDDKSNQDIYKEVDLDQQVKNELDQEQKQKVLDHEKELEKTKVLSFADRVKMRASGMDLKSKSVFQEDQEEFVALDMTDEDYKKIKDKKNAEKKKMAFSRNNEMPLTQTGPRKFFSDGGGAVKIEKKSEEVERSEKEDKVIQEQKQREVFQRQVEKEKEMEERMKGQEVEDVGQKKTFNFRDAPKQEISQVIVTEKEEEGPRLGFRRNEQVVEKDTVPAVYKSRFTSQKQSNVEQSKN